LGSVTWQEAIASRVSSSNAGVAVGDGEASSGGEADVVGGGDVFAPEQEVAVRKARADPRQRGEANGFPRKDE